jgi:hypothetical protein
VTSSVIAIRGIGLEIPGIEMIGAAVVKAEGAERAEA